MMNIPPFKPGAPIKAAHLEQLRQAVVMLLNITVSGDLQLVKLANGIHIAGLGSSDTAASSDKEGYLDGGMAAGSIGGSIAATATLSVWEVNPDSGVWEDTGENITVNNRSMATADTGTYLIVSKLGDQWRPVFIDCNALTNDV
jgi:hypothetical protein